jgi:hypothetical protein
MPAPQDPRLVALLALWNERRGERSFPARRDFTPFDFAAIGMLGHLSLVEVHREPLRFRFRLMGTLVAERAGFDATGKWLHDLAEEDYRTYVQRRFLELLEQRRPMSDFHTVQLDGRAPRTSEVLRLPFASDGETIDMLMTTALFIKRC